MEELNFGKRVEQLLKERNVKPVDFYSSVNIIPQQFYDWKNKSAIPNARTAYKVAQFFGVTIEYLITGSTENPLQEKVKQLQEQLYKIREFVNNI